MLRLLILSCAFDYLCLAYRMFLGAEGFEATCLARLDEFADKDPRALATTKAWLREGVLVEMMAHEAERVRGFLDGWFSTGTQERIQATVASLQSSG